MQTELVNSDNEKCVCMSKKKHPRGCISCNTLALAILLAFEVCLRHGCVCMSKEQHHVGCCSRNTLSQTLNMAYHPP